MDAAAVVHTLVALVDQAVVITQTTQPGLATRHLRLPRKDLLDRRIHQGILRQGRVVQVLLALSQQATMVEQVVQVHLHQSLVPRFLMLVAAAVLDM